MVVFISYNQGDKSVAREIAMFLVAEGINVWYDEWKISPGDSIIREIQNGLANCSAFVLVWSKNAQKSKWVKEEVEFALIEAIQKGTPKIIPIKLDETELPPFLRSIKYIEWKGGVEEDRMNIVYSITGRKPELDYIKAIVKKYHEVIIDSEARGVGSPLPYKACPECGSSRLKFGSFTDHILDENYFYIECKDCGWSTWTQ